MWGKDIITLVEPLWGKKMMVLLNTWVNQHQILTQILPWSADIFVFTYPVYLVGMYLRGVKKDTDYFKYAAFGIVCSAGVAAVVNHVLQHFGDKSRPESAILFQEYLLLEHLPTNPFPSDHAAVSAAIAMSTMLWGIKHNDKRFLRFSIFFWFACGVMSFSRVAVAIHWPTDILAGLLVGVLSALLVIYPPVWNRLVRHIWNPLIRLQKRLFSSLGQLFHR